MKLDVSRQVLPITERILKDEAKLGALALKNRTGKEAVATKLEWKEMSMGAIKFNLTTATVSGYFDDTDKDIDCDTTSLLVGDVISFKKTDGTSKGDLRIMITEIVSSTQAKAQKIGGTDVAIALTDVAFVESSSNAEGSVVGKRRKIQMPRTRYNYTQIVRGGHIIPRTQAQIDNLDFKDIKAELRLQAYKRFADDFNGMVTSTARKVVATAEGDKRIAGGLNYFANNNFNRATGEIEAGTTENVKVVSGGLTNDLINGAFKYAVDNGGKLNSIVTNTTQAIKLSELHKDQINVNVINGTNPSTVGGAVQILKSPIQVAGNTITEIYVDLQMPQDEIIFFNNKMIEAIPLKGSSCFEEIKEPTAKDDNYSIDLLGEWTIKVTNALENTYTLRELTV